MVFERLHNKVYPYRLLHWGLLLLNSTSLIGAQNNPRSLAYQVSIDGISSPSLQGALEQQCQTWRLRAHQPASLRQLTLRAQSDVPRLQRVLHSYGYYEGRARVEVRRSATPIQVIFEVTPGPLYTIGSWTVVWSHIAPKTPNPILPVDTVQGKPAAATRILTAEKYCLSRLKNQGYPFSRMQDRAVTLDPNNHQIKVTSRIDPGAPTRYGDVQISGLKAVRESYIQRRIPWRPGQSFSEKQLRELEKDLLQCGLFATVRVQPAAKANSDGSLDIHIVLSERKQRTVRLGGSYVTDEQGLGAQVSWEHRNLAGQGRRLRADLSATQIDATQRTSYLYPDIGRRDLDLLLDLEWAKTYPEAYTSQSVRMAASLQYHQRAWQTDFWGGIAQSVSTVDQQGIRSRFNLLEFPLGLDWDRRNDPLNATRGWQVLLQTTPQTDILQGITFFKHYGEVRVFQPLPLISHTALAIRAGVGAITGIALENVPADRRFYSGGAGSVRGYAYQSIGPTTLGKPSGGLSLIETSLELRSTWGDRWGTVAFLDGGTVFSEVFSHKTEEPMRWAAGFGLRYFLNFAPLRFDVAFPLNPERDDRKVQFYVSLGQAF